ncbi:sigma factor-like helix-turn-helix DNA-binding protein [Chloroflexus aggregans]|uniref:sigma factor-like helix-turn-helix DNA-binding protein n=1 Tax=Chloroflexus aggregans TaxID=152260 RepID=UPI0002EA39BB|nr:sigma factor-like helix-turn-helix DNA-binding protein [Chloroflexus aggregans]
MHPANQLLNSLDPELRRIVYRATQAITQLPPRLRRIIQLIHLTPKQIAEQTKLSLTSVRKYLDEIYCRLGLKRKEAITLQRDVIVALAVVLYQIMYNEK